MNTQGEQAGKKRKVSGEKSAEKRQNTAGTVQGNKAGEKSTAMTKQDTKEKTHEKPGEEAVEKPEIVHWECRKCQCGNDLQHLPIDKREWVKGEVQPCLKQHDRCRGERDSQCVDHTWIDPVLKNDLKTPSGETTRAFQHCGGGPLGVESQPDAFHVPLHRSVPNLSQGPDLGGGNGGNASRSGGSGGSRGGNHGGNRGRGGGATGGGSGTGSASNHTASHGPRK